MCEGLVLFQRAFRPLCEIMRVAGELLLTGELLLALEGAELDSRGTKSTSPGFDTRLVKTGAVKRSTMVCIEDTLGEESLYMGGKDC